MTYGQIRLRLSKLIPGTDLELIDGWIQDIYTEILDLIPWKRQEAESVIQSPPSYNVGTVSVTQGSADIVGTGTSWSSAQNGLMTRIDNQQEYYQFTDVDGTNGTLDRPYEGSTAAIVASSIAAAGVGYLVGDVLYITGGNSLAQLQVLSIGSGGSVSTYEIIQAGNLYAVASNVVCTGGNGTGFQLNITQVGSSGTLSYRIDQATFLLPPSCRIVRQVRPLHDFRRPLTIISPAELNRLFPTRNEYGTPRFAAPSWDSFSDPPIMQVELFPVPSVPNSSGAITSWSIDYAFDAAAIDPTQTSASMLPWVRPAALINGVQREAAGLAKDDDGIQFHDGRFKSLVNEMLMVNANQRGPQPIQLAPGLRRQKAPRYRYGPKHQGYTG